MLGFSPLAADPIGSSGGANGVAELPLSRINLTALVLSYRVGHSTFMPIASLGLGGGTLSAQLVRTCGLPISTLLMSADDLDPATIDGVLLPLVAINLHGFSLRSVGKVTREYPTVYYAELSGERLNISSLQVRLNASTPSYLAVVLPRTPEYSSIVVNNPAGELILYKGIRFSTGEYQMDVFASGTLTEVRSDIGPRSRSITLVAYGDNAAEVPRRVEVEGVSYLGESSTGITLRAKADATIKPRDTIFCDYAEFQVGRITTYIALSSSGQPLEYSEFSSIQ